MDGLKKTDFLSRLSGEVFLSQHQAIEKLTSPETTSSLHVVQGAP